MGNNTIIIENDDKSKIDDNNLYLNNIKSDIMEIINMKKSLSRLVRK